MDIDELLSRYPREVELKPDGKVTIRVMDRSDRDAVLAFARNLPEEDLLFLRTDLTEESVVDEWVDAIDNGLTTSLIAYEGDMTAGYASVHRTKARWTRRVGEIRVNVGPEYRSRGLGRNLTAQIFDIANALGLMKLMANMTADQIGAQAAFRRLGFTPEAMLGDFVEDRDGRPRDLVMMTYDMDGLSAQAGEPLRGL